MVEQIPRCATCKWWTNPGHEPARLWMSDTNSSLRWGQCGLAGDDDTIPPDSTGIVSIGTFQFATVTREDFGCVQHNPKDDDE